MTRTDIESIEKQDNRRRYVGKRAPRTSRKKHSAALVVGGRGLMKLESGHNEKERLQAKKKETAKRRQRGLQNERHITSSAPSEFLLPVIGA